MWRLSTHTVNAVLWQPGDQAQMSQTDKQTRALKCKPSAGDMIIKKPEELRSYV